MALYISLLSRSLARTILSAKPHPKPIPLVGRLMTTAIRVMDPPLSVDLRRQSASVVAELPLDFGA